MLACVLSVIVTYAAIISGSLVKAAQDRQYDCRRAKEFDISKGVQDRFRGTRTRYFKFNIRVKDYYDVYTLPGKIDGELEIDELVLLDGNCRVIDRGVDWVSNNLEPGTYYIAATGTGHKAKGRYDIVQNDFAIVVYPDRRFTIPDVPGSMKVRFWRREHLPVHFTVREAGRYIFSCPTPSITGCQVSLNSGTQELAEYPDTDSFERDLRPGSYTLYIRGYEWDDHGDLEVAIQGPQGRVRNSAVLANATPVSAGTSGEYTFVDEMDFLFKINLSTPGDYTFNLSGYLYAEATLLDSGGFAVCWKEEEWYTRDFSMDVSVAADSTIYFKPGIYYLAVEGTGRAPGENELALNIEGPEGAVITSSEPIGAEATAENIENLYGVDFSDWLKAQPGDLPDSLGGVKLGTVLVDKEILTLVESGEGKHVYELKYENGNVGGFILDDQDIIIGVNFIFNNKSAGFKDDIIRYVKNRFGDLLVTQLGTDSIISLLFSQTEPEEDVAISLRLSFWRESVTFELFHDERHLAQAAGKTEEPAAAADTSNYDQATWDSLDDWFGSPAGSLPTSLGGVDIGSEFGPGDIWNPVSADERPTSVPGSSFYRYTYESGNWMMVGVDSDSRIRAIQVYTRGVSTEYRDRVKSYMLDRFGKFLSIKTDTGDDYLYDFYQPADGGADALALQFYKSSGPEHSYKVLLYYVQQ